ncbi:uncharacterized protein LOC131160579 isoform X2 [Malania oleifera]|uniref:uncharacterized protein LOC131160579 isoform X2 n=1 Tax=Malania oleifera TaxID=397392 RepID=UPI0025AE7F0C|nr:uncharacterized protein LOC131160579 isoform X2 [Malania oleifera]
MGGRRSILALGAARGARLVRGRGRGLGRLEPRLSTGGSQIVAAVAALRSLPFDSRFYGTAQSDLISNGQSKPRVLATTWESLKFSTRATLLTILETDTNQADFSHARFQRTDQWIPVYSWLESLDKDEVVKSKEISDWLSDNPKIREQLCLRHSRYHLMHYIKKCHLKILKRRDKKKEPQHSNKTTPVKVQKPGVVKQPVIQPCNAVNNLPKDSDIYLAKRNEALHKYEILVELEEQLSTIFAKQ